MLDYPSPKIVSYGGHRYKHDRATFARSLGNEGEDVTARETRAGDCAGAQLDDGLGALAKYRRTQGANSHQQLDNAISAIEENNVQRHPHADGVYRRTAVQPQSFIRAKIGAPDEPLHAPKPRCRSLYFRGNRSAGRKVDEPHRADLNGEGQP